MPRSPLPDTKPFPWKCGHCRERAVNPTVIPYATEAEYDGRIYTVTVPGLKVPRCERCGELVLDSTANRQISYALRQQLRLLTPEQIRQNREALGLTQRQLAGHLGIAEATLSRWETGGQIQQRGFDRLLRLYFSSAGVREDLANDERLADLGSTVGTRAGEGGMPAALLRGTASVAMEALFQALAALPSPKRESAVREFQQLTELMK
jgi:putative zinc finger/helix-turn-helix YgiT family protein